MTKSSKVIGLVAVVLSVFLISACENGYGDSPSTSKKQTTSDDSTHGDGGGGGHHG